MIRSTNRWRTAGFAASLALAALGGALVTSNDAASTALAQDTQGTAGQAAKGFVKFDGVDGEATDPTHDKWIDVLSIDWGAHKPGGGATGQSRRRGSVVVEDITLTMEYDKAGPKLQEACLNGQVIPKLEVEATRDYDAGQRTYLKYELTNVQVTSFQVGGAADEGGGEVVKGQAPLFRVTASFEEVKVTYTEIDRDGGPLGTTDFIHSVKKKKKK